MEYTIKPGTQTDTKIRLKNKGVPSLRNKNLRGNHFVTLVVQVPERMTEAQKEALRRFQEAMGEVPAADSAASETAKPEHEKHEKHEKHERKGFLAERKRNSGKAEGASCENNR